MSQQSKPVDSNLNPVEPTQTPAPQPRALTYDETKAAEAAFRGEPFNPAWSASARKVYEGILMAMGERQLAALGEIDQEETECV